MIRIAVLWCSFFVVCSCVRRVETPAETGGGSEAAAFYPLAVGNEWTYQASMLGETRSHSVKVVGHADGYYRFDDGNAASPEERLTVDGHGVRDEKRYLLREPLEQGRTWTNVVSASAIEHYKVIAVGEPCEVPAGKFLNCVRVESRNRVDPKVTLVNELTFAEGVGLVRVKVTAEDGNRSIPQSELTLSTYRVAPPSDSARGS